MTNEEKSERERERVMGFLKTLDDLISWRSSATVATVAVTERYARRVLKLKKKDELQYRGLKLKCIGSAKWRANQIN
jgi:hypothetical protein